MARRASSAGAPPLRDYSIQEDWIARTGGGVLSASAFSRSKQKGKKGKGKKKASTPQRHDQQQRDEMNEEEPEEKEQETDLSSVRSAKAAETAPGSASSQPSSRRPSLPGFSSMDDGGGAASGAAATASPGVTAPRASSTRRVSAEFGDISSSARPAAASSFGGVSHGDGTAFTVSSSMKPENAMASVMGVLGPDAAPRVFIYLLQEHMAEHVQLVFSPMFGGSAETAATPAVHSGRQSGGANRGFTAGISVVWSHAIIGDQQLNFSFGMGRADPATNPWCRMSYGFWEPGGMKCAAFMMLENLSDEDSDQSTDEILRAASRAVIAFDPAVVAKTDAHRTGGWDSLEPGDVWGGGTVLFVDKVALPMVEVAIGLMKVIIDNEELDNMAMAIKRVRRWAVLEKGGSSNTVFQKEFFRRVFLWAHGAGQNLEGCLDITMETIGCTDYEALACPYLKPGARKGPDVDSCDEVPETLAPANSMLSDGDDGSDGDAEGVAMEEVST
ncbi:unnamed protein product [Ectocarpus sp. 6 AP-2014]